MEELQAKHHKELRDLQSRITQKKKSATKKTRKGVNDECAALERYLHDRHQTEIAQLDGKLTPNPSLDLDSFPTSGDVHTEDVPTESMKTLEISDGAAAPCTGQDNISSTAPTSQDKRPNRQKARLARRAAEQEALAAQAAEEATSLPDLREQEKGDMEKQFIQHDLVELEVRSDGHCLYSAVASQLKDVGLDLSPSIGPAVPSGDHSEDYMLVREAAASFMKCHEDDFSPFLDEPLDSYVAKITNTAEWGGQLELQALARAYGVDINILQAAGRPERIESGLNGAGKEIWLAYYRHHYGLGEHYNALRKKLSN